jgi:hypothetical protein
MTERESTTLDLRSQADRLNVEPEKVEIIISKAKEDLDRIQLRFNDLTRSDQTLPQTRIRPAAHSLFKHAL